MVWTDTRQELLLFEQEINQIHPSIKFTFKYSPKEIDYLDTIVMITNEGKLTTRLFKKPTDRSNYLHNKSYHPNSLKKNIPYGQALRIKKICTDERDYEHSLDELQESFLKRGYNKQNIREQFTKVSNQDRSQLLTYKPKNKNKNQLLFITTYNKTLPRIQSAIEKQWNLLQINEELANVFQEKPKIAYRRNKNLRDMIGQTTIKNNKIVRNKGLKQGKCRPCFSTTRNKCCRQMNIASTFQSQRTKQQFKIFHNTNCKSSNVIYLMECKKCKIQYVGKTRNSFNTRLNDHRSNAYNPTEDSIPACLHFHNNTHDFNRDAKFTIIEQLKNTEDKSEEQRETIILQRENFWIKKLQTLTPHGLNQELN